MESVESRRFWLGLVVSLALVFLLAMALAPWAGHLIQPYQSHGDSVHKSPIAATNGRDISYLYGNHPVYGGVDNTLKICDYSYNDKKALGRAFNNGHVSMYQDDHDGAYGSCFVNSEPTNSGGHDACGWRYDGSTCGPNSDHGS